MHPMDDDPLSAFLSNVGSMPMFDDIQDTVEYPIISPPMPSTTTTTEEYSALFANVFGTADQPPTFNEDSPIISPEFSPAPSDFASHSPPIHSLDTTDFYPSTSFEHHQPMFDLSCAAEPEPSRHFTPCNQRQSEIDLDKLNMLYTSAQKTQVRKLFPDLLPTLQRLRDVALKQQIAAATTTPPGQVDLNTPSPVTWPYSSGSLSESLSPLPSPPPTTSLSSPSPSLTSLASPQTPSPSQTQQITSPQQQVTPKPKSKVGRKRKPRPSDPLLLAAEQHAKRQKNTEAARRSRLRKMLKMDALEEELRAVMEERDALRERVAELEEQLEED
ncbi:hypothetical protein DFS34DRAFT_599999 [Phlyctochytrium arcticum]|nr:hypothetical protein DFS34DRAFT_599999 [Phlyctochytrium arcticum]